jgi:hypothetical protein
MVLVRPMLTLQAGRQDVGMGSQKRTGLAINKNVAGASGAGSR